MKSIFVVSLLASIALAQPHGHHHDHRRRAARKVGPRDLKTEWVVETVTVSVTELIDDFTTTWITPSLPTQESTGTQVPGQFFEGASSSSSTPAPPVATPETSAHAAPAPQPETTTPVAAPPAAVTSVAPAVVPPPKPSTTAAAAPAPASQSPSGGSSSGAETHTGEMTYFGIGMGSCGIDSTGQDQTKKIVALSAALMGLSSNNNPLCGKTITISYGGKTTTAVVEDKCPVCAENDIDVSEAAFEELLSLGVGRQKGVTWWFNE